MGDWSWDGGGGVLDPGSLIITFLGCRALRNLLVQHFLTVLPRDLGVGGGGVFSHPPLQPEHLCFALLYRPGSREEKVHGHHSFRAARPGRSSWGWDSEKLRLF